MAKAPTPGVGKRAEESHTTKRILNITINGESKRIALNNLSFREKAAVRKETGGLPVEVYWNDSLSINGESVLLLWWLARRANGEPNLPLAVAEAELPDPIDWSKVKVVWEDAPATIEGDDPES